MLTSKQLLLICGKCNHSEQYAPLLWGSMSEWHITTVTRAASFLGQLAHESDEFNALEEYGDGKRYEGRQDLGNINWGDGPRYKGRGFIQLTGKNNYKKAGEELCMELVKSPELAADPRNAARIAAWFWASHGLNELADECEFGKITKIINGALGGLNDRIWYYRRALEVLGAGVEI